MSMISIYGSHDSSICIQVKEGDYRIYEVERLTKKRYDRLNTNIEEFREKILLMYDAIANDHPEEFDVCFHSQLDLEQLSIVKSLFKVRRFKEVGHHLAHAASTLYQSPFDKCLIVSFDGGGFDEDGVSTFNIYIGDKKRRQINRIDKIYSERTEEDQKKDSHPWRNVPLDLGNVYSVFAIPIKEIKKGDDWGKDFLAFAGKIMGLVAYGKIREEWIEHIKNFYLRGFYDGKLDKLQELGLSIGLNLGVNTIEGQDGYDLAATSQYVFEEIVMDKILPHIQPNLPLCLTGGCALNVLLNERIRKTLNVPVYISPNPSDCGLSLGMMLLNEPPSNPIIDITYKGFPILDINQLDSYIEKNPVLEVDVQYIANLISDGNIIGVIREGSECGPRSLGNRSILCDPSIKDMKEKLNDRVKYREWFRPFAPVVRKEEVHKYFDFEGESPYMSFAPMVRQDWIDRIPAVVHEDKTARVQTVTKEQNQFLYDLLGFLEEKNGVGVVLNTSFNIKGNPILTTIHDALTVLNTTQLDYVVVQKTISEVRIHQFWIPTVMDEFDETKGVIRRRKNTKYLEELEPVTCARYFLFQKRTNNTTDI